MTSGASTTRYYLSLDGVKNAGDTLLVGTRTVPGLAAGASSSGTVTVTIPSTTPLNTYSLLACADDLNTVVETNEGNNWDPICYHPRHLELGRLTSPDPLRAVVGDRPVHLCRVLSGTRRRARPPPGRCRTG